jgi:NAD(P)H-hydrate epimerase
VTAALPTIPKRDAAAHKGDYGHVIVAAGSVGMTGAAALASDAAVRSGAGLVTLLCPRGTWGVLATQLREVMVRPVGTEGASGWMSGFASEVEEFVRGVTARGGKAVLAVGPGMGRSQGPAHCAKRLAEAVDLPLVLDADGIVAFEGETDELAKRAAATVLTPHPGEAARLVGDFDGRDDEARRGAAEEIAEKADAVVVLKGHRTVVAGNGRVEVNETGNPGMATGGTGDVLTGVIAGLLAIGLPPFDAARLGAHVHGLAGDIAAQEVGCLPLAAGDVLRCLPAAFGRLCSEG